MQWAEAHPAGPCLTPCTGAPGRAADHTTPGGETAEAAGRRSKTPREEKLGGCSQRPDQHHEPLAGGRRRASRTWPARSAGPGSGSARKSYARAWARGKQAAAGEWSTRWASWTGRHQGLGGTNGRAVTPRGAPWWGSTLPPPLGRPCREPRGAAQPPTLGRAVESPRRLQAVPGPSFRLAVIRKPPSQKASVLPVSRREGAGGRLSRCRQHRHPRLAQLSSGCAAPIWLPVSAPEEAAGDGPRAGGAGMDFLAPRSRLALPWLLQPFGERTGGRRSLSLSLSPVALSFK